MNYNMNTFKSFKTDGKVWEMVFEETRFVYHLFSRKKEVTDTGILRGACYKDSHYNASTPCFRNAVYDDPRNPVLQLPSGNLECISDIDRQVLFENIFKASSVSKQLEDSVLFLNEGINND